jgi:hypothetical protein
VSSPDARALRLMPGFSRAVPVPRRSAAPRHSFHEGALAFFLCPNANVLTRARSLAVGEAVSGAPGRVVMIPRCTLFPKEPALLNEHGSENLPVYGTCTRGVLLLGTDPDQRVSCCHASPAVRS